jgi:hypothetical protein
MDFTSKQLEQLLSILKRGKWELTGEEIIAVSSSMAHIVSVLKSKKQQEMVPSVKRVEPPIKKIKK